MQLNESNYFSKEADMEYMSVSQFKSFAGSVGLLGCEYTANEMLHGRWERKPSTAMLVGSYVDAFIDGTLDTFKVEHPEIFTGRGALRADFEKAERVIDRITRDEYFMKFLSGEKQTIMIGELFGAKWKIKMDSYMPHMFITDLKVMGSISKLEWVKDLGKIDFVRYWGYDIQGAVYQEIVRQNTGEKLPFYIAVATKEEEPDIRIIHVTDNYLKEALAVVERQMPRVLAVKNGEVEPDRCEQCDCCKHNRVLKRPISIVDLSDDISMKG